MAEFDLSKKVGPLPLGVWGVVVAGGLFVGYMINRSMAAKASEEPEDAAYADSDVGRGGSQLIYTPPVTAPEEGEPEPTNALWGTKATNYLTSLGYEAVAADQAVRKYLSALALSDAERLMINTAILHFGVPPEPLPPSDQPPNEPPPPPASKPVTIPTVGNLRAVRIRRGVNISWTYSGPAIGGFRLKIRESKSGRSRVHLVPARNRSYHYVAPRSWNSRTNSNVEFYIQPFRGGFAAPNKTYGPTRHVIAKPII